MSYFGQKKILAALMAMEWGPNGSQGSLEPYFGPKQNIRLFANSYHQSWLQMRLNELIWPENVFHRP